MPMTCPHCGVSLPLVRETVCPQCLGALPVGDVSASASPAEPTGEDPSAGSFMGTLPTYQEPPKLAPAPESPEFRLAEFQRSLAVLTPRVWVTPALVGLNVLLYLAMVLSGVSIMEPTVDDLLRWGAIFGPKVVLGEWWRLLTCTFIHIGIIHLLFNMAVLGSSGPLVERMVGNVGFLLMYLVSGLCGSVGSLLWRTDLVSAGASGAIFGIYGALLGMLARQRDSIPKEALLQLRNIGLGFLLYNFAFGLLVPNIDYAGHVGGLLGGFLCGLVLSQPFTTAALAHRPLRNALVAGVGALLVGAGVVGVMARSGDVGQAHLELLDFEKVEKKVLDAVAAAAKQSELGLLTDVAFADLLERDVLPEWRQSRQRLAALTISQKAMQVRVAALVDYMRLRQEAWELFAVAFREGNEQKVLQAVTIQNQADAAARRIIEKR